MSGNDSVIIKRSNPLWLPIVVILILTLMIIAVIFYLITSGEWFAGIIVLIPGSILYILMFRGLITLKQITIGHNSIEVRNYWDKKLEFTLHLNQLSKLTYHEPVRAKLPFDSFNVTAIQNDTEFKFSIKGFYTDDFVRLFKSHDFPIFEKQGEGTIKVK